jgi:glycosyltransferase involved in cell wall biosynthesis
LHDSLHVASVIIFGLLALGWVIQSVRGGLGLRKIPHISAISPAPGDALPRVSIVFAARDEEEKLPAALASMLALDYPDYEVIAADDRSTDGTGEILDQFARDNPRLRVLHVTDLPSGWLGKPHALEAATSVATGEWLLFTDADVRFDPLVVRRAMALAGEKKLDHLTLLANVDLHGFWERVAISYFAFCFTFGSQAWRVSDPKSTKYLGVGAFQLVRRAAYQASGTHKRLAMEVLDDMKLGKILKQSGFRSGVAAADGMVRVRWHDGVGNMIRGVTKNMFGSLSFRISLTLAAAALILISGILPFAGLIIASGAARVFSLIAALAAVIAQGEVTQGAGESRLYGLTHPLGAVIFIYMMLRSMVVTLRLGGVVWRDTFYPLDELRRGIV